MLVLRDGSSNLSSETLLGDDHVEVLIMERKAVEDVADHVVASSINQTRANDRDFTKIMAQALVSTRRSTV